MFIYLVVGMEEDGMKFKVVGVFEEVRFCVLCGDEDGEFLSWFSWVCDGKLEKLVGVDGRVIYIIVEGDDDEVGVIGERFELVYFFWWEESDLLYVFSEFLFLWFDMNNKCFVLNLGKLR